jgi:hypothetical protein
MGQPRRVGMKSSNPQAVIAPRRGMLPANNGGLRHLDIKARGLDAELPTHSPRDTWTPSCVLE